MISKYFQEYPKLEWQHSTLPRGTVSNRDPYSCDIDPLRFLDITKEDHFAAVVIPTRIFIIYPPASDFRFCFPVSASLSLDLSENSQTSAPARNLPYTQPETSMLTITLIAALISLLLTFWILSANPYRLSNQAFALTTLVQTMWLGCVYRAIEVGNSPIISRNDELEFWFRANAAVVSVLPTAIWLVKNAILSNPRDRGTAIYNTLPVFLVSILAATLCFTESFVSAETPQLLTRGLAYYLFILVSTFIYSLCIIRIVRELRNSVGIRRVELQFLGLNAGGAALVLGILNAVGNYLNYRPLNRFGILLLIAASGLTAWALLFHRVFNAREVLMQLSQRGTFVLLLVGGTYGLWSMLYPIVGEPFGLLLSIMLCGSAAVWLDRGSRAWFESANRRKLAEARKAAIDIGNNEVQTEMLVTRFEALLQSECNAQSCTLLFDNGEVYSGADLALAKQRPGFAALIDEGWTTPESLLRRKPTHARADLQSFVDSHTLGLLMTTPKGSPTPSLIVALGRKADESPFTYPEIERLQTLVALLDNLLARSRRAAHAALLARMEYLAVASRGLAHDLKNLITPVSTYLQHTDGLYPPESPAGEVHASAKRATQIMSDYVRENLFFAEKLSPKFERFEVAVLLEQARDAVSAPADARKITIAIMDQSRDEFVADRVLLQRLLVNLLSNAIDASPPGGVVTLSARGLRAGWIRLDVSDQGTGIPQENIARIFDPYFTTKEFGNELRGFGLGLTIAQKIALLHHGEISVSSRAGQGTTFSVDLPNARAGAAWAEKSTDSMPVHLPTAAPVMP